ncbi:response regulator transcription factor [Weissella soli]|uniref:LuxR family two component transcriptional regulator n=1 Tax=Weissella soli TaxID=155866 RepID=A0A288Q680_9LACO|nr:response regulator transcription factor [Weissella soli]AOT56347.1 Chemotaxis response regulator protein-glutamate methylesterase [Weissella soli]NKY82801.1 response regulator transcription factor [Weissella soli]RDL11917.1 LuxR family two component transcriptional regulator [Weissella soli]GEN92853.1 DNA-binding response regulator [Weissella soli]
MNKKIMVVDNHFLIREGLKLIFENIAGFEVAYEASNGTEAIAQLKQALPDVILLDIIMDHIDGFGVMAYINEFCPQVPVVVLTTVDTGNDIKKMLNLGAKGYLLKDAGPEQIINTVNNALEGNTLLHSKITQIMSTEGLNPSDFNLNDMELMLLTDISKGLRIKDIAIKVHLSERTVKNHLSTIYNKMSVSSGIEAVALAAKNNLI